MLDLVESLMSIWIGSFLLRLLLLWKPIFEPYVFKDNVHNVVQVIPFVEKSPRKSSFHEAVNAYGVKRI